MNIFSIVVLFEQNMGTACIVYIYTMFMHRFIVSPFFVDQETIDTIEVVVSVCTKHSELYIAQITVGSIFFL